MRSLLSSGIKAILAIAALSTAAHWAMRLQRDAEGLPSPAVASLAEPATTGSVAPRQGLVPAPEPQQAVLPVPAAPRAAEAKRAPAASGLDQSHLAALIATSTGTPKPKAAKR